MCTASSSYVKEQQAEEEHGTEPMLSDLLERIAALRKTYTIEQMIEAIENVDKDEGFLTDSGRNIRTQDTTRQNTGGLQ